MSAPTTTPQTGTGRRGPTASHRLCHCQWQRLVVGVVPVVTLCGASVDRRPRRRRSVPCPLCETAIETAAVCPACGCVYERGGIL